MARLDIPSRRGRVGPWKALVALWFLSPNGQAILRLHPREQLPLLLFGAVGAFLAEFVVPPMDGVGLVWAGASAVLVVRALRALLVSEALPSVGQELSSAIVLAINAPLFAEFVRILGGAEPLALAIFMLNVSYACGLVLRPLATKPEDATAVAAGHVRSHRAGPPPAQALLGPVIGRFGGRPIYAWIDDSDGRRFSFDCVAPTLQQPGAQRFYDQLCREAPSWMAFEGAIYRAADGALPGEPKSGPSV